MHSCEAIQLSIDYIENNLNKNLSTKMLADMVGLSMFYYQRLFCRLVHKPVQEYIKLRRLAHSIELLNIPDKKIIDIAFEIGYSSHANYTKAFKESFGITPNKYRTQRPTLNTFIKPELSLNYTIANEGIPLIIGDIILEINQVMLTDPDIYLGYEAPVYISEQIPVGQTLGIDVPGELWKTFHRTKKQLPISFTNNIELGVSHSPDSENNSFMYFVGGSVPNIFLPHFDSMTPFILQPGKYIVCKIEADTFEFLVTNALYQANNYLYEIWLPQNKLTPSSFCAEKYFKGNTDVHQMELWLPISIT